jgi:cell pole-organizing protein PopZ
MGQASSAQREPSMEEILASIRRIIEDGDGGRKADDVNPTAEPEGAVIEVDAFRAELRERAVRPAETADKPATVGAARPVTLADVQASLSTGTPEHEAGDDIAEAVAAAVASSHEAMESSPIVPPAEQPGPAPAETLRDAAARPALISERPGRQVAAAFGELSEAFAANRRRSFDEMAEDMLRPMLQDWLDNNLPMLVERLVREEIERVARGA